MQQLSLYRAPTQGYGVAGCHMIYITRVQSVRVLKRLRKRFVRFMTPAVELAGLIYMKTIGKQLLKLKKEIRLFWGNFRKDREHLKGLFKGLTLTSVIGRLQHVGLYFVIREKFVMSVLNTAAPVCSVFLLLDTISYWNHQDHGLALSYDGKQITTIKDESVFEKATEVVNQRMVYNTMVSVDLKITPTPILTAMGSGRFYAANTLCGRLIQQSNGTIEEGSGLYIDGGLIGAVESSADATYLLQNILNAVRAGDRVAKASFSEGVEAINGLLPTANIISAEDMAKKLTGSEQAAMAYTVKDGDTATSITRQYNPTLLKLNRLNSNRADDDLKIGMQLNVQTPQTLLHVKVVKKETRATSLPYKTAAERGDSQYTDYSKIVTQGQEGIQEITEEVTYVNGIETSRTTLSKHVATGVVNRKVVTDIRKRPQYSGSGESSGSLMWPVSFIRNIISYLTYRWGRMHAGIDIPGGNSYGKAIVTTDGGVVSYVKYSSSGYGYHLQINHGSGISALYGYASKILVSSGQRVSKGQSIVLIGSTGDPTDVHLHFEVIKNGQKVNLLLYVNR